MDRFMAARGYLPIAMKHGVRNRFYLQAKLNGHPVKCLLDTGATDVVLDSRKATALNISQLLKEPVHLPFGTLSNRVPVVAVPKLEIAAAVFSNYPALVLDLHRDRRQTTGTYIPVAVSSDEVDLIIGMEFLTAAHAAIACDIPALYLRSGALSGTQAENFEASLTASGYSSLPLLEDYFCAVKGQVNGKDAVLRVDTGAIATSFDVELGRDYGLADYRTGGKVADLDQNKRELRYAKVQSIRLAGFDSGPMPVGIIDYKEIRALDKNEKAPPLGFLGPEVLYRAHAIIDCSARKLYVKKAAEKPAR